MGRLLGNTWIYAINRGPTNRALGSSRKSKAKQKELSKLQRKSARYWDWRRRIFVRDKFTCQKCFKVGPNIKLEAHHINEWYDEPSKRFHIDNGITLCVSCHTSLHPWRANKYKKYRVKRSSKVILRKAG